MGFSASSDSSGEQHKYSQLDEFAQSSELPSDSSESTSETSSEIDSENSPKMSDNDAIALAGMGVEQISKYVAESLDAPIVIDESHQEEIAKKGAVLIKKYLPNGDMPPWLMAFKAEIEFGLAVGACAFSVYRQNKAYEQSLIEANKVENNGD